MTEEIKKLIIYTRKMKKREPLYRDYPEEFREEIRGYLESNHISRLYAHQVEMFEQVRSGENVVITTSTASGKTLAFLLPVWHTMPSRTSHDRLSPCPLRSR